VVLQAQQTSDSLGNAVVFWSPLSPTLNFETNDCTGTAFIDGTSVHQGYRPRRAAIFSSSLGTSDLYISAPYPAIQTITAESQKDFLGCNDIAPTSTPGQIAYTFFADLQTLFTTPFHLQP